MVGGINDGGMQHHLLAEVELTFKTAFSLVQGMEEVEHNTLEPQATSSEQLHVIKTQFMQEILRQEPVTPYHHCCMKPQ